MKKLSLLALVATAISLPLVLTGCNNSSTNPTPPSTDTNTPATNAPAAPTNASTDSSAPASATTATTAPGSESSKADTNAAPTTADQPAGPSQNTKTP